MWYLPEQFKDMKVTLLDGKIIPRNVIVETIFGCNSSCIMCPINMPTIRKKGLMSAETFRKAIDGLAPYADKIVQIDLFGVGEPFLDKDIHTKIHYTKSKEFKDVGFATNADLMTPELVREAMKAGIDTIMISLDGVSAPVHESIRVNTSFPRIVANVKAAIALRDQYGYKTKFVMRFIRQTCNMHEWASYREFWTREISKDKGDRIIGYDLHSWGGEINVQERRELPSVPSGTPCHHVFDRLIILNDGAVTLCCSDMHRGRHILGNVNDDNPVEIFNNDKIRKLRKLHLDGRRSEFKMCADCTILESESAKELS